MAGMIQETFSRVDNIVGIANAGIPWATSVADQLELPMAYLRPDKKAHGIGGHVQGRIRKGSRIVIVDDLVASGGSLKSSITSLLSEVEVDILGVSSIINWGFMKMRDNLDGFQYVSLTSYPQIVMAATARGKVKQEDFSRLLDFYVDPSLGY
jgi:orotate phosphoribosyltransferase